MSNVRSAVAGAGMIGKRHVEEVDACDEANLPLAWAAPEEFWHNGTYITPACYAWRGVGPYERPIAGDPGLFLPRLRGWEFGRG